MFLNSLDFFFLRHYQVQSSPLSSEKIHSKSYSAREMHKEPPFMVHQVVSSTDTRHAYDGFCTKTYLGVYQIQELCGDSRLEETFQKSINIEILIL